MSDLVFLIVNASIVCFVISYGVLKIFRTKVLLVCLIFSPFILIPIFSGAIQQWLYGYVFVLQYGVMGIVFGIVLFEIDQIKRAKKLRYVTSWLAKIVMIFPMVYMFSYLAKSFIKNNETANSSMEYASIFGLVSQSDIALVERFGSYFHFTGTIVCLILVLLCLSVLILNKYRAFKEVQRI